MGKWLYTFQCYSYKYIFRITFILKKLKKHTVLFVLTLLRNFEANNYDMYLIVNFDTYEKRD